MPKKKVLLTTKESNARVKQLKNKGYEIKEIKTNIGTLVLKRKKKKK